MPRQVLLRVKVSRNEAFRREKVSEALGDRFFSKICPEPNTGCWLWTAGLGSGGYGCFGVRRGKGFRTGLAHRLSFEHHFGPIAPGLMVCHRCDTRACVNPGHLFLGTAYDNSSDMDQKGRGVRGRGEKNKHAKLTKLDVLAVRFLKSSGTRTNVLAAVYGVSTGHINKIARRFLWSHL